MEQEQIRQIIKRQLPLLIEDDPELQELILRLSRREFAGKDLTDARFDRILNELRTDRELQERKWEQQKDDDRRRWDEQNHKWAEQKEEDKLKWEEQARKWDEQKKEDRRRWDEQARKWEEQKEGDRRKWIEQDRKWDKQNEEYRREFDLVHEEIMENARKHDRTLGALGARWGIQTEAAFRNALAAILEGSFGVEVLNVTEFDDEGQVFGRPDQIELDVIIKNGLLILCEIKSPIDKGGMYLFERKVRFYEQRHQRQANRMMVISPMIERRALPVAKKLGIECYSDAIDVTVDKEGA